MTLDEALRVLADSHTRDDDGAGFLVEDCRGRYGRWTDSEYIEAWKTVRHHLHLKTEPAE